MTRRDVTQRRVPHTTRHPTSSARALHALIQAASRGADRRRRRQHRRHGRGPIVPLADTAGACAFPALRPDRGVALASGCRLAHRTLDADLQCPRPACRHSRSTAPTSPAASVPSATTRRPPDRLRISNVVRRCFGATPARPRGRSRVSAPTPRRARQTALEGAHRWLPRSRWPSDAQRPVVHRARRRDIRYSAGQGRSPATSAHAHPGAPRRLR